MLYERQGRAGRLTVDPKTRELVRYDQEGAEVERRTLGPDEFPALAEWEAQAKGRGQRDLDLQALIDSTGNLTAAQVSNAIRLLARKAAGQ